MREYERALRDYRQVQNLSPGNIQSHQGAGDCYAELKNYKAAAQEYNSAINNDPTIAVGMSEKLVPILYKLKDYNKALEECDKVIFYLS